jgi:hypothetical protein
MHACARLCEPEKSCLPLSFVVSERMDGGYEKERLARTVQYNACVACLVITTTTETCTYVWPAVPHMTTTETCTYVWPAVPHMTLIWCRICRCKHKCCVVHYILYRSIMHVCCGTPIKSACKVSLWNIKIYSYIISSSTNISFFI